MAFTSKKAMDYLGDPEKDKKKKQPTKRLVAKKTVTNRLTGEKKEYGYQPLKKSSVEEMFGSKK